MHSTLLPLFLLSITIPSSLGIPLKACTPDFTSWPPPVSTLPTPFSLRVTAQSSPGKSFSLSLPPSTIPLGFSTNLTNASKPGPKVSLRDGSLTYADGLIFGRNSVEDRSTLPKKLFFLDAEHVRGGGVRFEAVYVCGSDGVQRRVLQQQQQQVGGVSQGVIAVDGFREGGGLVAVIMEDQVLKPDIWLEIV